MYTSTEETLACVRKYNTTELFDFFKRKGLQLNDTHFRILLEEEIDGAAFLLLNEIKLKACGFKVGTVVKLADLIVKLNGEERASLPQDESPITSHLPETASGLLHYYDIWNRPYSEWPNLREFSDNLHEVYNICEKNRVHSSFKLEIRALQKLFAKEHPAQLRLTEMEEQLKIQQVPRTVKKTARRRIAKAIKLQTKKEIVKKELEIAQDTVIVGGYHRINKHYDDYHEASSQFLKRHLDNVNVGNSKKARVVKNSQK